MSKKTERWPVHYESIPHDSCWNPKHCDCDCDSCIDERKGEVVSDKNRAWFLRSFPKVQAARSAVRQPQS